MNPLLELQDKAGAKRDQTGHVQSYTGDVIAEYQGALTNAGLSELSWRGILKVAGEDRFKLLHNLCTADINALKPGEGTEAFFLDAKGHVLHYAQVHCTEDSIYLETDATQIESLTKHLDRYVFREDVQFSDLTSDRCQQRVLGQHASTILSSLNADPSDLPQLSHRPVTIADVPCILMRSDLFVESYEIVVAREQVSVVWQALIKEGEPKGLVLCGRQVAETLRTLAGIPAYDHEISGEGFPQEFDRNEQTVSFTKGCYIGQETVARIDAYGHVNRELRGLILSGETIPQKGDKVLKGSDPTAEVGTITTAVHSPTHACPVALAILKRGSNALGTKVAVASGDELQQAEVVGLPFNPPAPPA